MSNQSKKRRVDRIREMYIEYLDKIARRMDAAFKRQGKKKRRVKRDKRKAHNKGSYWKCTT